MIAQRPGRGDILHDDFDHLLAVLEERAANAFLIRVLSIGLQNSSYQLRSFERSIPVIRFASSATAEVLLPALDTPCHSPMRSVPDRSIHQSRQGKAPRSIQGASLPLRHGRPAAARALLQHCRVTGRSHISAMELSVWKVYPAQTSELNEDSRIKVVRPANTPAPQGCVSRSRSSARTAGLFFWGGQSGRR